MRWPAGAWALASRKRRRRPAELGIFLGCRGGDVGEGERPRVPPRPDRGAEHDVADMAAGQVDRDRERVDPGRTSAGRGKSVSGRVDLGGRRTIKKNKKQ